MDLVPYAVPFFFLAMLLELGYGLARGRNTYRLNDTVGSLFMGTLSTVRGLVVLGVGGLVYAAVGAHLAPWELPADSPWTWLFAWFGYDLCYYWSHRISHERQLFWGSHVAHHQSEEYNLSTALRQTSTGFILHWIFYLPLFLLGVPLEVYITVGSANLLYQFWVHTEHLPKLGWMEWVFITPSNHRVHHAQNDRYVDKNYGGVFILWDRLFGTYQEEQEEEPCIYGIRGPLRTFNPLWANLHIYAGMLQDAFWTRGWRNRLRVLIAPTGWRPADVADAHPRPKTDLAHFQKYDPAVSPGVKRYAFYQLLAALVLGVSLLIAPTADPALNRGAVAVLLLGMVCTAAWLDGRRQAWALDALRLALLSVTPWVLLRYGLPGWVAVAWGVHLAVNALWLVALRVPALPTTATTRA
jgi:sterol desaturase/sphingolipid hydroxylase (fatty acid hydroxylase superfamily)